MSDQPSDKNPRANPSSAKQPAPAAGLVPLSFVTECLKGAHVERPRKGQGRREPRHSRRKGP